MLAQYVDVPFLLTVFDHSCLFFLSSLCPDSGGMKEQDLMCIKLHGVNRIGLKKIIDFIYTAKLSLNMENLQDTLEAASFLQILPVLDFCKVFLISGVRSQAHKPQLSNIKKNIFPIVQS